MSLIYWTSTIYSLHKTSWCTIPPFRRMEKLRRLHGMRDLPQVSWRPMKEAADSLREFFSLHAYEVLETPIIEPTELFLRKSGGELAAQMYTFADPGGNQVSLRPEYTSSIVRHYLEQDVRELPLRIQYSGPVFRYEEDPSAYRQFTQVGAELLGSFDPRADVEILSVSCMSLSSLGLKGHRLELGDLSVLYGLLEPLGLSERALVFILSSITELKSGQEGLPRVYERAKQLQLMASDSQQGYLGAAIQGMGEQEAKELLHGLLQWTDIGSLGQREPEEVVGRLLRKFRVTDDPARLNQGLEIASRLATTKGEPGDCLKKVRELIGSYGLDTSVLDRLEEVMDLLDREQLQGTPVTLDFGLARAPAYYTGIIFDIKHPSLQGSLGGGGRYDGLARALGRPASVPALGFAHTLEYVVSALGWPVDGHEDRRGQVLVLASDTKAYKKAFELARGLRAEGTPVEIEVCGRGIDETLSYARAKGIPEVISVDRDGKCTTYQVQ